MSQFRFPSSPDSLPYPSDANAAERGFEDWQERLSRLEDSDLAETLSAAGEDEACQRLLEVVFSNSPFLTQCVLAQSAVFGDLLQRGPEEAIKSVMARLEEEAAPSADRQTVMRTLRQARQAVALVVALADIAGEWDLAEVTATLSDFADAAMEKALAHLLHHAHERGEIEVPEPDDPTKDCGYAVFALGKLGARELNYSSDVDLIVVFDPQKTHYKHDRGAQEGYVRLTRDFVRMLDERTRDGYVFRTDLRLRPDPSATPLAISFDAAETYYESLGQNWERAAMIKARAAAGDKKTGKEFLEHLRPFVWRRHLDFWAIQDVHSIKRQIHAHKGGAKIAVKGHNLKLGRGGIREIEFFVQTQQLIWGGREPRLRTSRTLEGLSALAEVGHVDEKTAADLADSYRFLRRLEHRLQMVGDQQTHSLPETDADLETIARFSGYETAEAFREDLLKHLHTVEDHYADLFEEAPSLSGPGNLVFTGGEPDPETLKTLDQLGFKETEKVFELVRVWHHGRYRATRSRRSREILTEIMPTLLESIGRTADPDNALRKFDEFLRGLPAGVQLFSMVYSNPKLLDLLAEIMGNAPNLAETLSRNPGLLDAVLEPGFFDAVPAREALADDLGEMLNQARDFQDVLDLIRRWTNDRKFQVGVQLLQESGDVDEAGRALSDIAEAALDALWQPVIDDLARRHGHFPPPGMAVLALGKLGGREMTISSDLDLIFVYEVPEDAEESDGEKPLPPSTYFGRLAQRYVSAVTSLTGEGQLYEIDARLRPSGNSGPLAVSFERFRSYQKSEAWTWEHMALTRARVIIGDDDFGERLQDEITTVLAAERDGDDLLANVADMRRRIAKEHKARTIWQVKHLRGGLVDLEFLAQYWQLRHAHDHPEILRTNTQAAFDALADAEVIDRELANELIKATRQLRRIQGIVRLTVGRDFNEENASEGIKATLAKAGDAESFDALKQDLENTAERIYEVFRQTIEEPGDALADNDEGK